MGAFEYERKEYQDNLERIKRKGTYQDYKNAIYEMIELKNDLKTDLENISHIDSVALLIDQVDNVYWGDIAFHSDIPLDKYDIFLVAEAIVSILQNHAEDCYHYSLYYNEPMQSFMYTKVSIEVDDGPDLYAQEGRQFVIR